MLMMLTWLATCFNPRARRGRDLLSLWYGHSCYCFNPRARRGRDVQNISEPMKEMEFQSTLPQGARRAAKCAQGTGAEVSIHAPAGGATGASVQQRTVRLEFQSTRPQGARQGWLPQWVT